MRKEATLLKKRQKRARWRANKKRKSAVRARVATVERSNDDA